MQSHEPTKTTAQHCKGLSLQHYGMQQESNTDRRYKSHQQLSDYTQSDQDGHDCCLVADPLTHYQQQPLWWLLWRAICWAAGPR